MPNKPVYQRILLKLSGEALMGGREAGIAPEIIGRIADEIKQIAAAGVQIAIVIGGGNIFRGVSAPDMDRAQADYMGMLATVINALSLQDALEHCDVAVRVQTALRMEQVAEPYIRLRAIRHLEKGRVVIFGAGTGNPFFTTDTAASLRAAEISAQIMFKATKVDGVYDKDPMKHNDAKRYDVITYDRALADHLAVMDATAVALCRDQNLPVCVFSIDQPGTLSRIIHGERIGTLIQRG